MVPVDPVGKVADLVLEGVPAFIDGDTVRGLYFSSLTKGNITLHAPIRAARLRFGVI